MSISESPLPLDKLLPPEALAELEEAERKKRLEDDLVGLKEAIADFGDDFEPFLNSDKVDIMAYIQKSQRDNVPPDPVNPWQCRIGLSNFLVPPINISYSKVGQVGNIGGGLRTASSTKFNTGHAETMLTMTIYFPDHQSIWGFSGKSSTIDFDEASDARIDRYMSSLRGLVTQFKYAPFLPIENAHINGSLGINAVALQSMQVSTIDGFPFALAVQLNMLKFNHDVYVPMVPELDNAIHWGRYRQYMGRGAKRLNEIANSEFLTGLAQDETLKKAIEQDELLYKTRKESKKRYKASSDSTVAFNLTKDWDNGKSFDLYYPAHTPTKVAYPDLTFFESRDMVEKEAKKNWWQDLLGTFGFDYSTTEQASYENVNTYFAYTEGQKYLKDENMRLAEYLRLAGITHKEMGPDDLAKYMAARLDRYTKDHGEVSEQTLDEVKLQIEGAWFATMYKAWSTDPMLEKEFAYQEFMRNHTLIKEWEVPMKPLDIDDVTCFVQSVSVSMGNNLVRQQLQMTEEPAYQHIGALDTQATISMIIFSDNEGQDALTKFTRAMEHVNGMARLEHGHGVLGFFGIKNTITALCGMKYCLIKELSSESIENQPGAYRVTLSVVDFDVFQQKREMLSNSQQAELVEAFSKRNPFLRIKQRWGAFSAYPDLPLSVRNNDGDIIGHLDPDYYFKAFETIDAEYVDFESYDPVSHHTFMTDPDNPDQGVGLMLSKDGIEFLNGDQKPTGQKLSFWEANADWTTGDKPVVEGMTPLGTYQAPYIDSGPNPKRQFETMLKDTRHRDNHGRMIRAFPTYMLWLIDEGGNFYGTKLFDNFYGLQSVNDIALVRSEDSMDDTLILQMSNIYSRLSTPFRDLLDESLYNDAKLINTQLNRTRNLASGLTDYLVNLDTIDLQPGVRVHLRMGYSANPNNLETVFNGTIAEVTQGETVTIVCQSDAMELSAIVNARDEKANTSKIDGSVFGSFTFSEPRDLMTRMLSMGGSTFRETVAHATRGKIFSENRFGIKHFGVILTDEMTDTEKNLTNSRSSTVSKAINSITAGTAGADPTSELAADTVTDAAAGGNPLASNVASMVPAGAGTVIFGIWDLMTSSIVNLSKDRDFELYKRNIYPGNGTGIAQFMGGDFGDGGLAIGINGDTDGGMWDKNPPKSPKDILSLGGFAQVGGFGLPGVLAGKETVDKIGDYAGGLVHPFTDMLGLTSELKDDDPSGGDEVSFKAFTYMKSVWDIFQTCAALLPNYIVAIRPFEDRSTVFYGKPHWLYTSAVIPLTKGIPQIELSEPDKETAELVKKVMDEIAKDKENDEEFYDRISSTTDKASSDPNATAAGMAWNGGDIGSLPQESKGLNGGTAYIPHRTGTAAMEMHLPTAATINAEQHKQLDTLASQYKWPYYMDRAGGARGGVSGINSNGEGETILKGEKKGDPGQAGSFGLLPPEEEQWYIAMRWSYANNNKKDGCSVKDYRNGDAGKRILVYNERTKGGVICTPGDYGPSQSLESSGRVAGLSPDAWFTLGAQTTDNLIFGFVDDSSPLGPVNFSSQDALPKTPKGEGKVASGNIDEDMFPDFFTTEEAKKKRKGKDGKLSNDVAGYALQWGWKDDKVNVNYTNEENGWIDEYGAKAAEVYTPADIDNQQAERTWDELRKNIYTDKYILKIIEASFPVLSENPPKNAVDDKGNKIDKDKYKENQAKTQKALIEDFLKFMWQNPYHRGWAVLTADKRFTAGGALTGDAAAFVDSLGLPGGGLIEDAGGLIDELTGDDGPEFDFDEIHKVFTLWLTEDTDAKAVEYMKTHKDKGKSNSLIGRAIEEGREKIWGKITEVFKSILTSIGSITSGVVNMLRMSMMVLSKGVEMATFAQQQANKLNKIYNDSIYYQAGPPGSLRFLVDNPFTREYHEPVVEVREPFQRIHMISSFNNIIDNKITEFSGVTTVVNATSGGGHPVTVYFDKGAPSDQQVETSVETGLKWERPTGVSVLRHPIKALESFATHFNNGDQETSAKRVALWFLKEGLKDIYGGEIVIVGDPQIRPHDLLYIADVYERIYGLCEVEQVVHHFNPEVGFVTSITPNAIVTINDPAKWTMTQYVTQRLNGWHLRQQMQHDMNKADRGGYVLPQEMSLAQLAEANKSGLLGSLQYTGGNTALIKDFAASENIGALGPGLEYGEGKTRGGAIWDGIEDYNKETLGQTKAAVVGGTIGQMLFPGTPGVGQAFGMVAGWKAWGWVKDNLMDQQSCYIQYLSKDGKPMYGGLAFNRGVAVGQQRTSTLFKDSLRIQLPKTDRYGNGMISTDDLLANLGWNPKEIDYLVNDMDLYTNITNAVIYDLAGRPTPDNPPNQAYKAIWVKLYNKDDFKTGGTTDELTGEEISAVEDGDTLIFSTDAEGEKYTFGVSKLRLAGMDAPELAPYLHRRPQAAATLAPGEPATQSFLWLNERLRQATGHYEYEFAVRVPVKVGGKDPVVDENDVLDIYGSRALGWIFADAGDPTLTKDQRKKKLMAWASSPYVGWTSYQDNGIPYTINWESVSKGYSNVYLFGLDSDIPEEGVEGGGNPANGGN